MVEMTLHPCSAPLARTSPCSSSATAGISRLKHLESCIAPGLQMMSLQIPGSGLCFWCRVAKCAVPVLI